MQLPMPVPRNQVRPMEFFRRHIDRPVSRNLTLGIQVLILLSSVVFSVNAPTNIDPTYLALCLLMALSVISLQFVYRATGPKPVNWLSIDIVALLPMLIIHLGVALHKRRNPVVSKHNPPLQTPHHPLASYVYTTAAPPSGQLFAAPRQA